MQSARCSVQCVQCSVLSAICIVLDVYNTAARLAALAPATIAQYKTCKWCGQHDPWCVYVKSTTLLEHNRLLHLCVWHDVASLAHAITLEYTANHVYTFRSTHCASAEMTLALLCVACCGYPLYCC